MAYDPFGDGKWSVRALLVCSTTALSTASGSRTLSPIRRWSDNFILAINFTINFLEQSSGGQARPADGPVSLTATGTPAFKVPSYIDYNLSVQHEVMHNTVLEVGYVGTKGSHQGDVDSTSRLATR
jgi:hypothetical protein